MLNKAIEIATKAHNGQVDKGGKPYIQHPLRVLQCCESEIEPVKICAVLHDVIEDTNVSFDDLMDEGFSDEVLDALKCLTRIQGESYNQFIDRILTNEIACKVKLCDLIDNMDLSRIPNHTNKDKQRNVKYIVALNRIKAKLIS